MPAPIATNKKRDENEIAPIGANVAEPIDYSKKLGNILVVDDNRLNRKTLVIYLTKQVLLADLRILTTIVGVNMPRIREWKASH